VARNLDLALALFPVLRDRRGQLAGSMRGGEQQMVALARILMAEPRVLLIDGPSVGLSPLKVRQTMEAIAELRQERGLTVLIAEQNFRQAMRIADHGCVIAHGCIAVDAAAHDLASSEVVRAAYFGG
jgi:branched-chain amino acid transport system ATP-binding protein